MKQFEIVPREVLWSIWGFHQKSPKSLTTDCGHVTTYYNLNVCYERPYKNELYGIEHIR